MTKQSQHRNKWLTIRLNEEEYEQVEKMASKTLCPTVSDYGRRVLLQKPVNVRYRNQSLDDFVTDMALLRKDLNAIGGNFNQAVHRLHTLHIIPEIQQWILINEQDKTHIFRIIETISNKINDAYNQWSHE